MALKFPARVKAQTSTTGTGTYTVTEPGQAGYRTFTRAVTDGDLVSGDSVAYIVVDTTVTNGPNLLEMCTGVWDNTAKTLTRATVHQPNGTPNNWGAGTRDIVVISNPLLFLFLVGGTMTGLLNILLAGAAITPATETGLIVQRSGDVSHDAGMSIISGTSGKSRLNLGDTAAEKDGGIFYDNATQTLYVRTAGVDRVLMDSLGNVGAFVSGTKMIFRQTTPPVGWTKDTADNDAALRVVSGAVGAAGGSLGLSSSVTGAHSLAISEMPSHDHEGISSQSFIMQAGSGTSLTSGGAVFYITRTATNVTGGGGSHTHPLALKYIDVISATKD